MQEKKKSYVKPFARVIALSEPVMVVVGSNHVDPGSSEAKPHPFFPTMEDGDNSSPFSTGAEKSKTVWDD